jgi:hypothetical protein
VTHAQESAVFVHTFRYLGITIGFATVPWTAARFPLCVDSFRDARTMIATCRPEKAARFVFPGRFPAQTFSDRHDQERRVFH